MQVSLETAQPESLPFSTWPAMASPATDVWIAAGLCLIGTSKLQNNNNKIIIILLIIWC
jgi:hypothetical protein